MTAGLLALTGGCTGQILEAGAGSGTGPAGAGGGASDGGGSRAPRPFAPAPAAMRRLTVAQYRQSVRDVFGPEVTVSPDLEPDESTALFTSIGAAQVSTSARGVEQYRDRALEVATQVTAAAARYPALASCAPASPSDPCVARAIEHFGRRLFRRALAPEEVSQYAAIVAAGGTAPEALRVGMTYALSALLQSPSFLYVTPESEPDPESGFARYTSRAMASRLSFFLWDAPPDDELLRAAEAGDLARRDGVAAQARRMLESPRARGLAGRFFAESWRVAGLDVLDKDATVYPAWSAALLGAYRREFDAVLEDLTVARDGDLRELFDGRTTFADAQLARVYGLTGAGEGFARVGLPDERAGLLTAGAVVAANSPSNRTSPTHRGVFVLERLLCQAVPPPPPDVDDTLATGPAAETLTVRERLERHRAEPRCAGCHGMFDPIGFTLENFDAIGAYRAADGDRPVDSAGEYGGQAIASARELAARLRDDPRATRCIAERLYAYAAGHEPGPGEASVVDDLAAGLGANGHRFRQLVLALVASDGFRLTAPGGQ